VHRISKDWRGAKLEEQDQALCRFAEKLSVEPTAMRAEDVQELRDRGFDDSAIHDATQVIAYFNYINRVADALGVEPEEFIRPWEHTARDS
jgi:uncharacterized peroxidase-related enzyme